MYDYLPQFSQIDVSNIEEKLDQMLAHHLASMKSTVAAHTQYTWANLIAPLDELDDELGKFWAPISHLNSVMNNDELRAVYQACLPKLSDYGTEVSQYKPLYEAIKQMVESDAFKNLDQAQQQVLTNEVRDFKLAGVALPEAKQQRYKTLSKRLSELTNKFEENILDATNSWTKLLEDDNRLSGLPDYAIQMTKEAAQHRKQSGFCLTLEFPCYHAVVTYADDRKLREEIYTAFSTRASDVGPDAGKYNNQAVMEEILQCRAELASLLDFSNYAEYSLARKMAETPEQVMQFLHDLAKRSRPQAKDEFAELQAFSKQLGHDDLQSWDIAYYSEKLRQQKYAFSEEDVRPYFPETKVIPGMFTIVEKLYGIHLEPVDNVDVWHKDVKFYNLYDSDNSLRGQLYMDLYARPKKRGGAWMDDCIDRRRLSDGDIQVPVAFLTCNFAPPSGNNPALFSHDEVITLFHEFGHCLHHLLTKVDYIGVSGINGVKWDAVELPSQFFENWCWEREALDCFAGHYETNESLPDELFQRMLAAKNFQAAMQMIRQLEFSIFDFQCHLQAQAHSTPKVQKILDQVRKQVSVVPVPEFNRFQHGFSHIFAGGYAAGYYSYKWAEVLSADAYSKFEETGIFNQQTGREFLNNILEKGGSAEPMVLYVNFRGREPTIDALLRHNGITI